MYLQQVQELYSIFSLLNQKIFNSVLIQPVISIQSRGKLNAFGWCTLNQVWKGKQDYYEINLSAEFMDRSINEIVETLLHEMVHLDNIYKEIKDTSRKGNYHNKRFSETALKAGLGVSFDTKNGWAYTFLSPPMIEWLSEQKINSECFTIAREDIPAKTTGERAKTIKYKCKKCGIQVKSTDEVNIICEDCDEKLELVGGKKEDEE